MLIKAIYFHCIAIEHILECPVWWHSMSYVGHYLTLGHIRSLSSLDLLWISWLFDSFYGSLWVITIRIELLKAWHDVINLEFIVYLMMFQFHFYLSLFNVLYFMSILTCIRNCKEDLSHEFFANRWLVTIGSWV